MRKVKMGILVAAFLFITIASSFAMRIGLEFGNPSAVIVLRFNPIDLKIGYNFSDTFGSGGAFFHISGDYRIIEMNLIDFLNLYIGAGAYAQFIMAGETGEVNFGGRIPLGLNAYLAKNVIEVFVEAVPTIKLFPQPMFGGWQGYLGFTVRVPKF